MQKKNILFLNVLCLILCLVLTLASCGKKADPKPMAVVRAGTISDLRGEVKDGVLFLSFTAPPAIKNEGKPDSGEEVQIAGFKVFKGCGTCLAGLELYRTINIDEKKGYAIAGNRFYFYDDDVMPGQGYAYRVYPFTRKGTRGEPSNVCIVKWEEPPGPPGPVRIVESDARVEIIWTKEEGYLYNIYRHDDGVYPIFPLNQRPTGAPLYMDAGLVNGRTYLYEVRKVRDSKGVLMEGEGVKISATPRDKTAPDAPAKVKAQKKGATITITWNENTEKDLAGYNVYRIMGSSAVKLNKELLKENRFLDRNAPDYRFIAYYVTAVDNAGNESESSQESIVILQE